MSGWKLLNSSFVGTAGWSVPKGVRDQFPPEGTQLQRYSARLNCCEINSTFYRLQRPAVYARWAATVGPDFRFSLKAPKQITHQQRLHDSRQSVREFLESVRPLTEGGDTVLLFQLPPSLIFEPELGLRFFEVLRAEYAGPVACEPRHPSWFEAELESLWQDFQVARAAVDPAPDPRAIEPAGWRGLSYFRWHGSPRMYYSSYDGARLQELAEAVQTCPGERFCIFDNTASGEAAGNALELRQLILCP